MQKFRTMFVVPMIFLATAAPAVTVNDPAPAFELADLQGQKVSSRKFQNQVLFINFWASWCPPCKDEFPRLDQLAAEYANKDVKVLAITLDKATANVHKFLGKNMKGPLHVQLLRDPAGKTAAAFGARAMPMSYVVDRQGHVKFLHMGYQKGDEAKWRAELDTLLKPTQP